ncbi:MAG: tRNA 2-thiouridine(34) synthase MnmA [Hyphomicrobiales bacterium]
MRNSLGLNKRPEDTRVVVAMSGGVDSSVVAGMMCEEGYDVIGITLQLYDHGAAIQKKGACCAGQDIHDARRVAETLNIPHYVLDYESRFRDSVIDDFADSYLRGETPVPCISCNQTVKFKDLLATSKELGADVLVTGHYIRSKLLDEASGRYGFFRPQDLSRDQSYFLFATTQEQLDYLRFPLGDLTKPETRELAHRYGLSVAEKSDSQDICFVPDGKYADIILKLRPEAAVPGDIIHLDGRVLGRHNGIIHYTIGQRRGLGVATGDPLYVVKLDTARNAVIVGPTEALVTHTMLLRDINWLGDGSINEFTKDNPLPMFVKVRSTRPPEAASLYQDDDGVKVVLIEGEAGVSPGQACVFYENEADDCRVFGGGWIEQAEKSASVEAAMTTLLSIRA